MELLDFLAALKEQTQWVAVDEGDRYFERELQRELAPGHVLFGKIVKAVARSFANDDVLFLVENAGCAVVHLTYSCSNAQGFPSCRQFADLGMAWTFLQNES